MPIAAPDHIPSPPPAQADRLAPSDLPKRPNEAAHPSVRFADLLRKVGQEAERGEATVRGVLSGARAGRDWGPSELLALQAGVYRYGETVDLASKLVDKAGTDLRTVLQGQQ
jgi:hypothetical protein